ncbi:MAG: HD domain-containing protein [Actinobacteria bacterium]|nr:HD domain-containing protein [Actinomycetota bacterium]
MRFSDGRLVAEQLEREELEERNRRLAIEAAGLQALLAAIEARDSYMGDHSRYVAALAAEVARVMGLDEAEVAVVRQAAFLHDVGKVAIPDSILKKRGPFDETERMINEALSACGPVRYRAANL